MKMISLKVSVKVRVSGAAYGRAINNIVLTVFATEPDVSNDAYR